MALTGKKRFSNIAEDASLADNQAVGRQDPGEVLCCKLLSFLVMKRIDDGNKKEKHRMLFTRMGRSAPLINSNQFEWEPPLLDNKIINSWNKFAHPLY